MERCSPDPTDVLRRLFVLERAKYPAEMVGKLFSLSDAEDDRIWLAKANRAILSGQPNEAAPLAGRCVKRRVPTTWRSGNRILISLGPRAISTRLFMSMDHLPALARFPTAERLAGYASGSPDKWAMQHAARASSR